MTDRRNPNPQRTTTGLSGAPWAGMAMAAGAVGGGLALWSAMIARRAEAMAPAEGRFVDVDGARVHYVEKGSGSPIVLVHGLLGNLRHFTYAMLDTLAADHRVIAIDRPGSGYSTADGAKADIAEQAAILGRVLDRLGVERPLLVGHSMGGAVALAAALADPVRYDGLALIAPLTQPIDRPPAVFAALMLPPVAREMVSWTLAGPMGAINGPAAARAVFAPEMVPPDFATKGGGALTLRPATFRAASHDLQTARPVLDELAGRYSGLNLPVAILFGRQDAILDPGLHGEATAAVLPQGHVELVDGGHMLPITQPDLAIDFVREAAARAAMGHG